MYKLLFILLLVLSVNFELQCQQNSFDLEQVKIDSIFYSNFKQMKYALDSHIINDTHVDRFFVHLLTYLSGIQCSNVDFTGFCYYDYEKLQEWENWYKKNKSKITLEIVNWGLNALRRDDFSQKLVDSLKNLKIPYKE